MTTLLVNFVLDETGSMQGIKDATIETFNGYLDKLERRPENILFSLTKFNSTKVERVCEAALVGNVERLTEDSYLPGHSTPLHDAVGQTIRWTETALEEMTSKDVKVMIVIQTDGQENDSKEWKLEGLKALVEEKIAAGWQFAFLGADMDAWATGRAMGIPGGSTLAYAGTPEGMTSGMSALARSTASYAASGGKATPDFFIPPVDTPEEEAPDGQEG